MIVTTAYKPSPELAEYAGRLAQELGCLLVPRKQDSLSRIKKRHGTDSVLVADDNGLRYYEKSEEPLYFHPSMAYVRVKRLRSGDRDPLIEVSGCQTGDSVLDCTAGLGSDAIVFSYAVGPEGKVVALESEPVLYTVVREGLRAYETIHADVNEALRRIELQCANHMDWLAELPNNSFDIVYFDPMFRRPVHDSSALAPLRGLANSGALEDEAVRHAIRIARKSVVLKEHRESGEFGRLGFERRHVNKIAYGVINPA